MNNYIDKEEIKEKLYDKRVISFLSKYVFKYKHYLIIAFFLLAIITTVSLAIPYISKIIIDRLIVKEGNILNVTELILKNDPVINKVLKSAVHLDDEKSFLLSDKLRFFSKRELDVFFNNKLFSKEKYVLIEKPKIKRNELNKKIKELIEHGEAFSFDNEVFLINTKSMILFNRDDIIELRINDFYMIFYIFAAMVFLLTLQFISTYIQLISLTKLSNNAMKDLRVDLFKRVVSYEVSFFDKNPIGRILTRVTNDVEVLRELFSSVLVALFQDMILFIGITIVIFKENLFLASLIAGTFPLIVTVIIVFRIKSKKIYLRVREKVSKINAFLQEMISGVKIIQIFTAEKKVYNKFSKNNHDLFKANLNQIFINAFFQPLIGFIRWFVVGSVIYFGAKDIIADKISYGVLVLFLQYIQIFFRPLSDIAEKFDIIIEANAAGEKIISVFEEKSRIEKDKKKLPSIPSRFEGGVELSNVSFSYKTNEPVLKNIDLKVNSGESVAIVGETGSGKTTIISLISRFYDITQGKILIDGHDIKDIPYTILRKNISIVMQDVFLFSKTIKENITLNNDFNQEKFNYVTEATHIAKFINRFGERENKVVAERGATFSSGERQLLSFARALYNDPSILILDEATSNIDSETEMFIQDAIKNMIKGRTSIIIAHRLSTIKNVDKIAVINKGQIVESGKHEELIKRRGIYYNLYSLQFTE